MRTESGKSRLEVANNPAGGGDGERAFLPFIAGQDNVCAVTTGANFDAGAPVALFQATPRQPVALFDLFIYDLSRNGQRFLINTQVKQPETAPLSVILNWASELER